MSFTVKYPRKQYIKEIGNFNMENSLSEELLGVKFDYKLKFKFHIEDICRKASCKVNTFARLAPYMGLPKCRLQINTFFKSQFKYCLLIWMCCNRF